MATRTETALRNRHFNELVEKLNQTIPALTCSCVSLTDCDLAATHPKDLLAQLEVIRLDAMGQKDDVDNLKESGEELMSILEELDCMDTPKAKSIIQNLETITRNFISLTSLISEKQVHFEDLLAQFEATQLEIQSLRQWIQETLALTRATSDTSLDLNVLVEQIDANSKILAEIQTREPRMKLVTERCKMFGICDKISDLIDSFQFIHTQVFSRDQKLQNIRAKLTTVKSESEKISAWVLNACLLLESPSKNGMLRMRLDEVYRERMEKEKSLECVRRTGKELVSDSGCADSSFLRDSLANLQSSWRHLSDLIIASMSSVVRNDLEEFGLFATRLERHFSEKEIVLTDPEEASARLRCHTVLQEELSAKQSEADLLFGQFDHLLRDHVSSSSHNELISEIVSVQKRLAAISQLAEMRIAMLSEMLPLVSHLQATYSDLNSGLSDIQRDIDAVDVDHSEDTEHIRINQYKLKLIRQFLEAQQVSVNDAISVGHELQSVSPECDYSQTVRLVASITDKFEAVKQSLRRKSLAQDEVFRKAFTDVNETILDLRSKAQSLSDRISFADNVAANIFVLNQQLTENKDVISEIDHLKLSINEASKRIENLTKSGATEEVEEDEDDNDSKRSEIRLLLEDLETLHSSTEFAAHRRTELIVVVMCAAEKFFFDFLGVSENLHELRDRLASQKTPALSPEAVKQQQKDLQSIQNDLERVSQQMERCLQTSAPALEALGAADADREIKKCSDDFEDLQDEIRDGIRTRSSDLETALEVAENFSGYSKSVMSWLPEAERKIRSMSSIADTARAVRIQIEEFKVFKVQMYPWYSDIHRLSQFLSEMSVSSPETVDSFAAHVKDINDRWQELIRLANQREENLRSALIELGEIDHAVEDVMGLLQQIESDLVHFNEVYGDARHIELHLKKVEALLKDIASQKTIIRKLGDTIDVVLKRSGRKSSPLADRQQEMMSLFTEIQASARDRRDELLDRLKEIKGFVGSIDETIKWLNHFKSQLKISRPMGALLDTVHLQYNRIMIACQELETKEVEVKAILLNGEDMVFRCQQNEGSSLNKKLNQLRILLNEAKAKAKLIKNKIEDHIEKVEKFHGELSSQTKWLNSMERRLRCFRHPSKLVDKVEQQMQQLLECETDVKAHAESMKAVDHNGTYLKYFGPKQDTVYIKNLLMSTSIRWKKLQQTADEAHRILQNACSDNKRFFDSWKTLCDWMSEAEERLLHKVMTGQSARTKQDLDELKRFDLQMSSKQPLYCITRRQGVSMRDRCTKSDPEKAVISEMIEELSSKWNQLRSLVMHRQEKVDDCLLLSPGHCSDTLDSMLGWLKKSEIYLSDKQLILGDVNTVALLMDQLKEFQQELFRRMDIIQKIPETISSGQNDLSGQLEKVKLTLEQVNHMNSLRQASLHEALKLAEDFNESLEDIQKWLPLAETELKFRSIPNDEDGVIRLIENHDKFHEDLIGQEPNIEKMMYIAEEILVSCHPKAVSIIKYHMTIMTTRWQQALRRSKARSDRLQEALNDVRRSATLEEELAAWLKEAENHLKEKEKESLPNDRASIEALLKEQTQFHQKLCSRSKDIDKLLRLSCGSLQNVCRTSNVSLSHAPQRPKEVSPSDNVSSEFRQKWQILWQQSADRKKLLEDLAEQLIQAERGECFDFDRWRVTAQDWFRARKLRISDVFREKDRSSKGLMTKKQFVEGMLAAKFPSNAADLRTIFDILDVSHSGVVNYQEIVKAILSDYQNIPSREILNLSESELIREELRQQLSRCQCLIPFVVQRIDDNKFKFGEKGKLCLVRFVNSSITVRVGGGWMTISEFMDNFDPCRIKQRPSSRTGLISPPERSYSGRGGQISPPEGTHVNRMPNLTPIKGHRNEKFLAGCSGPRPKGLPIKQSARNVAGASNSLRVPVANSSLSPTNKRKSFHEHRIK